MLNNSMNLNYSKERRRKKKYIYIYIYIYNLIVTINGKMRIRIMNVFVKNTKKYQLIYKAFNPKRHSRAFKIILSILIIQKATFFLVVDTNFSIDSHTPRCHEKLCLDLYARLTQMVQLIS